MPDLLWPIIGVILCVLIAGTGAILAWRADGKNPEPARIKKKIEDVTLPDVDESAIGFTGVPNESVLETERLWRLTFEPLNDSDGAIVLTVTESDMDDPRHEGYWKLSMTAIKNSRRVTIEPVTDNPSD